MHTPANLYQHFCVDNDEHVFYNKHTFGSPKSDQGEVLHMNGKQYIELILQFINKIDESDLTFLRQIYTILKRHEERRERH